MRVGVFLRQKTAVFVALLFVVFFALVARQSFGAEAPTHGILPVFQEDESWVGQAKIQADIAELPLSFIANAGQADANVRFIVKSGKQTIFFTPQEIVFAASEQVENEDTRDSVVRLRFAGANGEVKVEGEKPLPGTANFFLGNDPGKWQANVPTYAAITYYDLYPGIDLIYSGKQGRLKSEFVVAVGADPTLIVMNYSGTSSIYVRENGALVLETPIGELIEAPPIIYQTIEEERVAVEGGYRLLGEGGVAFTFGDYVPTEPLIIDPSIEYSSYLGSSACDDGLGIAVDSSGNCYVLGATYGTNFPTKNPLQSSSGGGLIDGFVAKFNSTGDLVWATYLGGNGTEQLGAIALDNSNNVYVAGYSTATDFPTVNALQGSHAGGDDDAVVAKISADGSSLIYSTYFGGSGNDGAGGGIAVDVFGNAYVVGATESVDLPTVNAAQSSYAGGNYDNFVIKLNAAGSALVYGTYLGGSGDEVAFDVVGTCAGVTRIAIDGSGNAYIEGYTTSSDFPTRNPIQSSNAGGMDAYLTKLSSTGSLVYSTYLGGSSCDAGLGVAVDQVGCAYVLGCTTSPDFPLENALQASNAGGHDLFVTKVSAAGTSILYSTYLGGSGNEGNDGGVFRGMGAICVDTGGSAILTGLTTSSNFPVVDAVQAASGGSTDAYVAKLSPSGGSLLFSSYLGGSSTDFGRGIAVDWFGDVYICGFTQSSDFPTRFPFQAAYGGGYSDAFVAKLDDIPEALVPSAPGSLSATAVSSTRIYISWQDNSGNEDGFKIERKLQGGSYSQIATVEANATGVFNSGLSAAVTYCYRVRAYNTVGNSNYSGEDCATTLDAPPSGGNVYSFGLNHAFTPEPNSTGPGQLGLGDEVDRHSPTRIPTLSGIAAIAAGSWHSLVLLGSGDVYSFGENYWGSLGLGDRVDRLSPTRIPGLFDVEAIATSWDHCLVLLSNGDVYSFGPNNTGQLGHGASHPCSTPMKVPLPSSVAVVATGAWHSLIVLTNGDLYSFGWSAEGALGRDGDSGTPTKVPGLSNVVAVSAGDQHSLALMSNGDVYAFGRNNYGQLGLSDTTNRYTPTKISTLSNVVVIEAGANHSLVLTENGEVYSFGRNDHGQLGHGDTTDRHAPTIIGTLSNVAVLAAGGHSLVALSNGDVYSFGGNSYGQLGHGDTTERNMPTLIDDLSGVAAITAGLAHSLVLAGDGPGTLPSAPSSLSAIYVSSCQINLTWQDNSINEAGFKIERKTEGGAFAQIDTVGANTTSYSDSGLNAATTYCYKVRAYNAVGDSTYSNEDCDTTFTGCPACGNGDVNGDDVVDVLDARLCLQIATGYLTPTAAQSTAADVDGDGKVGLKDVHIISDYIIGIYIDLPYKQ